MDTNQSNNNTNSWYFENIERAKELQKKWRQEHSEQYREYQREYHRKYRQLNRDKINEISRRSYHKLHPKKQDQ